MYPYVRGYTSGLIHVALPRVLVPSAPRCDVGEVHLVSPASFLLQARAEFNQLRMYSKLQDIEYSSIIFALKVTENIQVPGIQNQRLLTNGVGPDTEGKPDMRIVKMVRRAHANEVDLVARWTPPQLLKMPVESLEFRKESSLREILIKHTY
jgi:hypothetical protein